MKKALVIGATGGIGQAISVELKRLGFELVVHGNSNDKLRNLTSDLDIPLQNSYQADMSSADSTMRFVNEVLTKHSSFDVLVNAMGQGVKGPMTRNDPEEIVSIVHLNLIAPMLLTTLFSKALEQSGNGRIINIGSVAALKTSPNFSTYCATKHGLNAYMQCAIAELKSNKALSITNIHPGLVDTEMSRRDFTDMTFSVSPSEIAKHIVQIIEMDMPITDSVVRF